MNNKIRNSLYMIMLYLTCSYTVNAQKAYSIDQLIDAAQKNSRQLSIKGYQVMEKTSKLREDGIRRYPSVTLDGSYQYNFKLPDISIPAGTIGSVSTGNGVEQLLPAQDSKFKVGEKGSYNVGINLYQPITQQFKLETGLAIDRADIKIGEQERVQTSRQLKIQMERLFYGALILRKTAEAERLKLALANAKLADGDASRSAGTSTPASLAGLKADIAGQEQTLLKLDLQLQDYLSEISMMTGIDVQQLQLQETDPSDKISNINDYQTSALQTPELQIAKLTREKAELGIKAIKQSNLPDFGIIAGYYRQQGSPVLPASSPYVGISLKWNIQDLFANKEIKIQRHAQLRQAEDNLAYTQQQLNLGVERAWRKIQQCSSLISAANKAVLFRKDELREQQDRLAAGFEIKSAVLETKVKLAQSETDLYTAKLQQAIAIAELNNISGKNQ